VRPAAFQNQPNPAYEYRIPETPTSSGLMIMLIAGIILIISLFTTDFLDYEFFMSSHNLSFLGFIGLIIAFIGVLKIYNDRQSHPEPHPYNMRYAFRLYFLVIILYIYLIIMNFPFVYLFINDFSPYTYAFIFFSSYALSIIVLLLWLIGKYKVLAYLIPGYRKIFLKIAIIFFIISIIFSIIQFISIYGLGFNYHVFLIFKELSRDFFVVSHILFIICFFFAYDHQKRSIWAQANKSQETKQSKPPFTIQFPEHYPPKV
jgi:hypothetical protein